MARAHGDACVRSYSLAGVGIVVINPARKLLAATLGVSDRCRHRAFAQDRDKGWELDNEHAREAARRHASDLMANLEWGHTKLR